MNLSELSSEEIEKFQKVHDEFIPKRKKEFQSFMVKNSKQKKKTLFILNKALDILETNGINDINKKYNYMEFHKRNGGFVKKDYGKWFIWHEDDGGAVPWNCYTVIFYLRKDHTLVGGDLEFKIKDKVDTVPIKSGTILQFKGDIQHCPQPTTGFGCRDIIVVFVKRTKK